MNHRPPKGFQLLEPPKDDWFELLTSAVMAARKVGAKSVEVSETRGGYYRRVVLPVFYETHEGSILDAT